MKNTGGRNGGSITAAQFLQRFVNDTPWAHLDIAGTGMGAPKTDINHSWGSGYGVRLLDRLVAEYYEAEIAEADDRSAVLPSAEQPLENGCCRRCSRNRSSAAGAWWCSRRRKSAPTRSMPHLWTYRDDSFLPHGTWRDRDAAGPTDRARRRGGQSESGQCQVSDRLRRAAGGLRAATSAWCWCSMATTTTAARRRARRLDRLQGAGLRGHLLAGRRTGPLAAAAIAI